LMDLRISHFSAFNDVYGFVAGDDVLRFSAMLLGEIVDAHGTPNDFIGHAGGDNFIIISTDEMMPAIRKAVTERFDEEVKTHYNFMDREQGFVQTTNAEGEMVQSPLMNMTLGVISPEQQRFADIREITEMAAEARRLDPSSEA